MKCANRYFANDQCMVQNLAWVKDPFKVENRF